MSAPISFEERRASFAAQETVARECYSKVNTFSLRLSNGEVDDPFRFHDELRQLNEAMKRLDDAAGTTTRSIVTTPRGEGVVTRTDINGVCVDLYSGEVFRFHRAEVVPTGGRVVAVSPAVQRVFDECCELAAKVLPPPPARSR